MAQLWTEMMREVHTVDQTIVVAIERLRCACALFARLG